MPTVEVPTPVLTNLFSMFMKDRDKNMEGIIETENFSYENSDHIVFSKFRYFKVLTSL
jgi:hypothetical protein